MEQNKLTLGSLFDGSGGFPLGGLLSGITPVWASEIEPFPIRVTTKRLPQMKHYGDVSLMDGGEVEPVDIITFGSPCQDMSIAGKREGLGGNRSGLFYQAVRIIKEMREKTNGKYPRYIVWENVPGAFSSNKGEDFRCVLESICHIADETVSVPSVKKWQYAGEIVGDGYSVAWRLLDAQYWGVPQRRKRIYLVADFTGGCAGKILFESEGLSGYTPQGFLSWQGTAGSAADCTGTASLCLNDQGGNHVDVSEDVTGTLCAGDHPPCVMESAGFRTEHSAKSRSIGYEEETSPTLCAGVVPATVYENHGQDTRYTGPIDTAPTVSATYGTGGNNQPFVVETPKTLKIRSGCEGGGKGALIQDDKSATLGTHNDQTVFVPFVKGTRPHSAEEGQQWKESDVANTLNTHDVGEARCNELAVKAYGICSKDSNSMKSDNPKSGFYEADTSRTLDGKGGNPSCNQGGIAIVAFTQNQRDEVRDLGEHSAAVCANAGTKQQTFVLQGSMIGRKDKNGPQGDGINADVSFTLNTADRHAVAFADKAATLSASDGPKGPSSQMMRNPAENFAAVYHSTVSEEPEYIVRRLTPAECARLQGFPDWWCDGLGTENPTEEEIAFWRDVFETHRKVVTYAKKPKTDKQIRKWLTDPYSDSAAYKLWGNGIALPCVHFVLAGIVYYSQFTLSDREKEIVDGLNQGAN